MKTKLIKLLNERKNLTLIEDDFKVMVFEIYDLLGDFDSNAVYHQIKNELINEKIIAQISGGKKIKNSIHWNKLIHNVAMSEKNLQNLKILEKINDFLNTEKEHETVFLKERSCKILRMKSF